MPNLLYIHSDQHNPFVTGCYGDPIVQTPHLDNLASRGATFDAAYCASPICVPSRMSMLTGRHPFENQVWTNEDVLSSSIPTIAHAMGAAGYNPVLIGRMHSIGPDQLHGYAERRVGDHGSNFPGGRSVDRGILTGTAGPHRISLTKSGQGQSAYQVHDEDVTDSAVAYLRSLGARKRKDGTIDPFSLTVGFMLPHPPYVARSEDFCRYRDTLPLPRKPVGETDHAHLRWWRRHTDIVSVNEGEIRNARAAYWGLVTRLDAMIGRILAALEEAGLDEDTLIVYTSDHGDMLGEHGLFWKHTFYEESVRVPLIMCRPGAIPAGARVKQVVSALDVSATVLETFGIPPLPKSSGRSLLPLLQPGEDETGWENIAFSEYCQYNFSPAEGCIHRMVRKNDWKLVYYHGLAPQLFHLGDDPDEVVDRNDDPACKNIKEELIADVLAEWDPESVAGAIRTHKEQHHLFASWASSVRPEEKYRWDLKPEMNYLDGIKKT